jgi:hypothetical protein
MVIDIRQIGLEFEVITPDVLYKRAMEKAARIANRHMARRIDREDAYFCRLAKGLDYDDLLGIKDNRSLEPVYKLDFEEE